MSAPPPYSDAAYPPKAGAPAPQQGYAPPPQQGYPPPPQQGYSQPQPQAQSTTVVVPGQTTVVRAGGCARCGGVIREDYSIIGIILAIVFFPIGILCCLMMKERRCISCNASY